MSEVAIDVAVLGAGSWGTALAKVLADNRHRVTLWGRNEAHTADIQRDRHNAKYLPNAMLSDTLTASSDLRAAVSNKKFIVSVVPSHTTREVLAEAGVAMDPETIVISASKGIENESLDTMDDVMKAVLPGRIGSRLAFLSGPSFAKEVGKNLPTPSSWARATGRSRRAGPSCSATSAFACTRPTTSWASSSAARSRT